VAAATLHVDTGRAYLVKERLRNLYRLAEPAAARARLDAWLAWACRCRIPALVAFSKTVRANRERPYGHAMRASSPSRTFGAVLGKALEPLPGGTGLILILVALQ
jgi:hypothetical protein